MHDESASMMEITKKSLRADLADAAFGKITAVYGAALSVSLDEILAFLLVRVES